jgi:hypothetical protein
VTATLAGPADLRRLADDDLAALYTSGSDGTQALVMAECQRRDRQAAQARRAQGRRAAVASEWESDAYAQYLRADQYARGNLLSAAGQREGREPWPMLWQGSAERAMALASEELVTFWAHTEPRTPTVSEYRRQARQQRPEAQAPDLAVLADPGATAAERLAAVQAFSACQEQSRKARKTRIARIRNRVSALEASRTSSH